ncbi:hypothetical protein PPYR_10601 [Photinus pyralis]|uniref:U5 small nuclear ribonucleoprotein TSSC4 n=1 Tax=Photinus pyralis TaxID=7054 RepID=A0A1Y1LC85_PHOPY|nr:uncharacterized protein LOC116174297 [Photinus pyralis]KAB0796540.1 hypothetical protein PPYR_10601 [Photinus pyralis]
MKTENSASIESKKFHINSAYKEFTDRQKNVFDQLGAIETKTIDTLSKNDTKMEVEEPIEPEIHISSTQHSKLRQLQGQESLFKKPTTRPLKHIKTLLNRTVPDYQINPHKWTRYTLDVPQEDMSDKANVSAAMSFLKELSERDRDETSSSSSEVVDEMPAKIVFKKVSPKVIKASEAEASVSFRNSKIVMPEYVVGQKVNRTKPKNTQTRVETEKAEIKLDHISNYDDGEDDN